MMNVRVAAALPAVREKGISLFPVEWIALFFLGLCEYLIVVFHLRFFFPDLTTLWFLICHYVGGIALALLAGCAFLLFRSYRKDDVFDRLLTGFRFILSTTIIVFCHFNLKLWAMLINPVRFDALYVRLDRVLAPFEQAVVPFRDAFDGHLFGHMVNPYHEVFLAMFFVSFLLAAVKSDRIVLEKVMTASALVLVMGAVAYCFAPAFGPFVFEPGISAIAARTQESMYTFYQAFIKSGGLVFYPYYFVWALAAMPSLHAAHSLVFTYFAYKHHPAAGIVFSVLCAYILSEAVLSNWHYWIDLPAGFLVAFLSIRLAGRFVDTNDNPTFSGSASGTCRTK